MQAEARMCVEPGLDCGVGVSAVVVQDEMKIEPTRKLAIQATQKFQKLLMAMPGETLADHLSLKHVEGGKERRRPVALVVVSHRAAAAALHGQTGLSAIQSLNLALLIHAKHHGLLRRVEIEAHDVGELLDESRIARQLEASYTMRLEAVGVP